MGSGTYGRVYSTDNDTNYAVKRNIVEEETDFNACIKELDILGKMSTHPYIIKIHRVAFGSPFAEGNMSPLEKHKRDDGIHFIMEKANCDAGALIRNSAFLLIHRKYAMCQAALGLEYLHRKQIMHLDIKPENLLYFNKDGTQSLKLCDFGISMPWTLQGEMSTRVITAGYRPPEIVMDCSRYDYSADVWSLGCVFYEMISGKQLYPLSADNNQQLLEDIFNDHPTTIKRESIVRMSENYNYNLPRVRKNRPSMLDLLGLTKDVVDNFQENGTLDEFLELLEGMLAFDPEDRWTMTQVIKSKFFQCWANEINATRKACPPTQPLVPIVHVLDVPERTVVSSIVGDLFNNRRKHSWYDHRILFQAISFYDRWIEYKYPTPESETQYFETNGEIEIHHSSSLNRKKEAQLQLKFLVCLYMAMKYFSPMVTMMPFTDLVGGEFTSDKNYKQAAKFENHMIRNVLKMDIYRGTLYEAADCYGDVLTDNEVCQLLKVYCNSSVMSKYTGKRIANHQIYAACRRMMDESP